MNLDGDCIVSGYWNGISGFIGSISKGSCLKQVYCVIEFFIHSV